MKIKKITKENYDGKVYNLELYSNNVNDDLYWIEGITGTITHNCFPKDISALQYVAKEMNVPSTVLSATMDKNKEVRTDKDWEKQIGRAVSKD
jgi:hypothetical protein